MAEQLFFFKGGGELEPSAEDEYEENDEEEGDFEFGDETYEKPTQLFFSLPGDDHNYRAHEFVDEWHPYDEDHQFNPFPDEGQQHNNSPHNNQYSPSQHNNTFMQTIPLSFPQNNTTNYKPPDPQSNRSKKVSQRERRRPGWNEDTKASNLFSNPGQRYPSTETKRSHTSSKATTNLRQSKLTPKLTSKPRAPKSTDIGYNSRCENSAQSFREKAEKLISLVEKEHSKGPGPAYTHQAHHTQRLKDLHEKAMHAVLQYGQVVDLQHPITHQVLSSMIHKLAFVRENTSKLAQKHPSMRPIRQQKESIHQTPPQTPPHPPSNPALSSAYRPPPAHFHPPPSYQFHPPQVNHSHPTYPPHTPISPLPSSTSHQSPLRTQPSNDHYYLPPSRPSNYYTEPRFPTVDRNGVELLKHDIDAALKKPDIKYSLTLTAARAIVTHIDELVDLVLDDLCREEVFLLTDIEESQKSSEKPMLPASPMSGVLHRVDQLFREEMAMRRQIEEFSLSPPNSKDKNNKTNNSTNTNNSNTENSNKTSQINITNNAVTGDVYLSVPAQGTTKAMLNHMKSPVRNNYKPIRIKATGYRSKDGLARETDPVKIIEKVSEALVQDIIRASVGELADVCDVFVGKVVNKEMF